MPDYTDKIGQRLDDPASVPAEFAHLVADDIQRVERILSFPVSGRVLDVGCSDGAITRRIAAKWDVETTGADVNPPQFYYTTAPWQRWMPLYVGWDVRQPYPYVYGQFDAVYACEVFEHLTDADAKKALQNIRAVLKPEGSLIVTVPNRTPHDLYEVGMRSRWAWPDHRSRYTLASLLEFLKTGGFPIRNMEIVPLYDGEQPSESIWLIVKARMRQ